MHLDLEQLARLVDEPAEPAEAEHLRGCLVCRRGLNEMRAQTHALGSLADPAVPEGAWAALEARLLEERLIRETPPARFIGLYRPPMRIAAAVALFLMGGAAGALLWRAPQARPIASVDPARAEAPRGAGALDIPSEVVYVAEAAEPAAPRDLNGARLAANGVVDGQAPAPRVAAPPRTQPRRATAAEADRAARELAEAQVAYVGALQRLAAIADPQSGNTPETRMAALDRLVQLTAQALERVPGDPVINGYHLAAVAERDALRRETRNAETTWF